MIHVLKNSTKILFSYAMCLPVVLKLVGKEVLFIPVIYTTVALTR